MDEFDWLEILVQEANAEPIHLNTKQFINSLSGEVKNVIKEITREQESFGNQNIFEVDIKGNVITLYFGDYYMTFYFDRTGNLFEESGTGQGLSYEKWFEKAAKQLMASMRNA